MINERLLDLMVCHVMSLAVVQRGCVMEFSDTFLRDFYLGKIRSKCFKSKALLSSFHLTGQTVEFLIYRFDSERKSLRYNYR